MKADRNTRVVFMNSRNLHGKKIHTADSR